LGGADEEEEEEEEGVFVAFGGGAMREGVMPTDLDDAEIERAVVR
jgi:hypothetical protein